MRKSILLTTAAMIAVLVACQKTPTQTAALNQKAPKLPIEVAKYTDAVLPSGLKLSEVGFAIDPTIFQNPNGSGNNKMSIDNNKATLGRVLFYDKNLSLNNTVACGSCHHQEKAFADGLAVSRGFEGRITNRSSMAFANPITQSQLFWDSRSTSLVDLALRPVQNHIEMGMVHKGELVSKLKKVDYYPELFAKAFESEEITEAKIADAIAQFVSSITTSDSKFDRVNTPTSSIAFSPMETTGHDLFEANCSSCHNIASRVNPTVVDGPSDAYGGGGGGNFNNSGGGLGNGGIVESKSTNGTTNIGLDLVYADNGSGDGKFKIPSLRNIALTAPYMHDGRFKSLDEVINHYTNGIKPHKNLDDKLKTINGKKPINLDSYERQALIAFLRTLTDETMIKDAKYSDPFNY
jgi:cytochrome c peroxidase